MKRFLYIIGAILLMLGACKPLEEEVNPFLTFNDKSGLTAADSVQLESGSFAQLHRDIFQATCANSGCHDGTFEPDFRSIESSYNTLVFQPMLKNDPDQNFDYRVVPNDLEASLLWARLNRDLDGQSGIMPLVVEPDSDWPEKREAYLAEIRTWILNGAPDIFGNIPQAQDLSPTIKGFFGNLENNAAPLMRDGGNGAILVPESVEKIELWFSLHDDKIVPANLGGKIYLSKGVDDFQQNRALVLETDTPVVEEGFEGDAVMFSHKAEIQTDTMAVGENIFLQVAIPDPATGTITRIPNENSPYYIKELFSIKKY